MAVQQNKFCIYERAESSPGALIGWMNSFPIFLPSFKQRWRRIGHLCNLLSLQACYPPFIEGDESPLLMCHLSLGEIFGTILLQKSELCSSIILHSLGRGSPWVSLLWILGAGWGCFIKQALLHPSSLLTPHPQVLQIRIRAPRVDHDTDRGRTVLTQFKSLNMNLP